MVCQKWWPFQWFIFWRDVPWSEIIYNILLVQICYYILLAVKCIRISGIGPKLPRLFFHFYDTVFFSTVAKYSKATVVLIHMSSWPTLPQLVAPCRCLDVHVNGIRNSFRGWTTLGRFSWAALLCCWRNNLPSLGDCAALSLT